MSPPSLNYIQSGNVLEESKNEVIKIQEIEEIKDDFSFNANEKSIAISQLEQIVQSQGSESPKSNLVDSEQIRAI